MAKFYGDVGYGLTTEIRPGVWDDRMTKRSYYGDVLANVRRLDGGDKVNSDISTGNRISIVADAYAYEHFFAMKYVVWAGTNWTITSVDVQRPRLILQLGEVYNGPTA